MVILNQVRDTEKSQEYNHMNLDLDSARTAALITAVCQTLIK